MSEFGEKGWLNKLVVLLVVCHLHSSTSFQLSSIFQDLFTTMVYESELINMNTTSTTNGNKMCSISVPSLERLLKSSEIFKQARITTAWRPFILMLRKNFFKFLRKPQAWDDRMIITHAGIRDLDPCTLQNAMTARISRAGDYHDTIPSLWIEILETGVYAPIPLTSSGRRHRGGSLTLPKSLRLLHDLYADMRRAYQNAPMFGMNLLQNYTSSNEDLCVLEIPSLWNLWLFSEKMQIAFNEPRYFTRNMERIPFQRLNSLSPDKLWFTHSSFRSLPCTLEMFFRPSTLSDIIHSKINIFGKRNTEDVNSGIDERQRKLPRDSNDTPGVVTADSTSFTDAEMENYSTLRTSLYVDDPPLTPLEDATIDFDFFDTDFSNL